MRIAMDIDGVLNYIEQFQLEHGIPYFRNKGYEVVNQKGFDITDIFGCSEEERKKFWKTPPKGGIPIIDALILDFSRNSPIRSGVPELLSQLYENGDLVYIVTERYVH